MVYKSTCNSPAKMITGVHTASRLLFHYTTYYKSHGVLFPEILIIQISCIIGLPCYHSLNYTTANSCFKSSIGFPFHLEQNPNSWPGSTSPTWSTPMLFLTAFLVTFPITHYDLAILAFFLILEHNEFFPILGLCTCSSLCQDGSSLVCLMTGPFLSFISQFKCHPLKGHSLTPIVNHSPLLIATVSYHHIIFPSQTSPLFHIIL